MIVIGLAAILVSLFSRKTKKISMKAFAVSINEIESGLLTLPKLAGSEEGDEKQKRKRKNKTEEASDDTTSSEEGEVE